jgi:hypothetical protein
MVVVVVVVVVFTGIVTKSRRIIVVVIVDIPEFHGVQGRRHHGCGNGTTCVSGSGATIVAVLVPTRHHPWLRDIICPEYVKQRWWHSIGASRSRKRLVKGEALVMRLSCSRRRGYREAVMFIVYLDLVVNRQHKTIASTELR